MKKWILFSLIVGSIGAFGQAKVKNAYKLYKKGEIAKAIEALGEVKAEDAELEFYYVRALCGIETPANETLLNGIYNDLIRANPKLIEDLKELEQLDKNFELNPLTFQNTELQFFKLTFNYYKGVDKPESWKTHNKRYPRSPYVDSAYYLEGMSALTEAVSAGGDKEKLKKIIEIYPNHEASKLAFTALGDLEFSEAMSSNSSGILRAFSKSFAGHSKSLEALGRASQLDFKEATSNPTISRLEDFIDTYDESNERRTALMMLDSLYQTSLIKRFDIAQYLLYASRFLEGPGRHQIDSLCNYKIYRDLIEDKFDQAIWESILTVRLKDSYGYLLVNRLIENRMVTRVPYLNNRNDYSIGGTTANLTGAVSKYKANVILREGDAWFRVKSGDKWGLIYVSEFGEVNVLVEAIYDDVSARTNGSCFIVSKTNERGAKQSGVLTGSGTWLVPLGEYSILESLDNGKFLVASANGYQLWDAWSGSSELFTDSVFWRSGLLCQSDFKGTIRAVYLSNGKKLAFGAFISVQQYGGTGIINIKVDGKPYLLVGDSLITSPTSNFVFDYRDARNYISGSLKDDYSHFGPIVVNGENQKSTSHTCDNFVLLSDFVFFSGLNGSPGKIVSRSKLSQSLTNVLDYFVSGRNLVVKVSTGSTKLLVPNDQGYSSVDLSYELARSDDEYNEDNLYRVGSGADEYDDPFYIDKLEYYSSSSSALSYEVSNNELVPIRRGNGFGYVNTSGTIQVAAEFNSVSPFVGWVGNVGQNDATILIDQMGRFLATGNFAGFATDNSFIYSNDDKQYLYSSDDKSATSGQSIFLCDYCNVEGLLSNDILAVNFNGYPAYIKIEGSTARLLGNYLSSSFNKFSAALNDVQKTYFYDSEPNYNTYASRIDELPTPPDLTFSLSKVKLKLALSYGNSFNVDECMSELRRQIDFIPDEQQDLYGQVAYYYYNNENYESAIVYFKLLEAIIPATFYREYGFEVAYAYKEVRNLDKAKETYSKCIKFDEVRAWNELGHINFEMRNFSEAAESWKNALASAKRLNNTVFWSDGLVFINIGAAYANLGDRAKMCEFYNIATKSGNKEAIERYKEQCN
jgi:outer membrane protein assembly factor BamD (BamD/ComL family)